MSASIYVYKLVKPTLKMLEKWSFEYKGVFQQIYAFINFNDGNINPDWKYYNKKSGWILKLFNKKRNVLFVIPYQGYFKIAFTFGDKAMELVLQSELPQFIKDELTNAKKYAEGRTFQIDVKF